MKHSTIESLLGMDLATLEAMSETDIEKYLEESLTVQPPIKQFKQSSKSGIKNISTVDKSIRKELSSAEQLKKLAANMGLTLEDVKNYGKNNPTNWS